LIEGEKEFRISGKDMASCLIVRFDRPPVGSPQDLPGFPSLGNCPKTISEEKSPELYPIA
jgi:hypothetical protein